MTKALLIILLLCCTFSPNAQQKLYIEIVTHNEENDPVLYNVDEAGYLEKRRYIKLMADYIEYIDGRWNFQSDWRFLQAVQNFDINTVTNNTNGKNLIRWMQEDKSGTIEIDCHAHQTRYNYADIAFLHAQLGVQPSGNVGGYITDTVLRSDMPGSNWTDMQDSLQGFRYPFYRFLFSTLWGGNNATGGGPGHRDENENPYFGMYKPDTITNFYTHNSARRVVNLFSGCNYLVTDTTNATDIINEIKIQAQRVADGTYPTGVIYYTKVMTNVRDINRQMLVRLKKVIDTVDAMSERGELIWSTISDVRNAWNEVDASIWKCDSIPASSIANNFTVNKQISIAHNFITVYPNPGNGIIHINPVDRAGTFKIYSAMGAAIGEWHNVSTIDIRRWGKGTYYLVHINEDNIISRQKIIYQ